MERNWKTLGLALAGAAVLLTPVLRQTALVAGAALGLAAALNVPVSALERRGLRRGWSAAAILAGGAVVLAALLLLCATEGCKGIAAFPVGGLLARVSGALQPVLAALPAPLSDLARQGLRWLTAEEDGLWAKAGAWLAAVAGRLPGMLLTGAVTVFAAFYAVTDWRRVTGELARLLPERWRTWGRRMLGHLKRGAAGWLAVQGRLLLVQFCLLAAGLALLRVEDFLLAAALIALLDALPLLGCGTALVPWALLSLLEGDGGRALGLLMLWLVVWLCRTLLEPRLMGQRVGVSPVWTLLAAYLGAQALGLAGLIGAPILL
ncbi:MAG: AI-2E family transporter, partial [Clostridiales bacterium]|nr:AI-2E family transporter [Clostridiales bacterium]